MNLKNRTRCVSFARYVSDVGRPRDGTVGVGSCGAGGSNFACQVPNCCVNCDCSVARRFVAAVVGTRDRTGHSIDDDAF